MLYILFTNDYELFLGANNLPAGDVLFTKTDKILGLCSSLGVPMTLFADICSVWRYREQGFNEYPDGVEDQLKKAVAAGHDVQVHIHPHWSGTEIVSDDGICTRYIFDPETLTIGNMAKRLGRGIYDLAFELLGRGRGYLENLLKPVDSGYRAVAYRAGGYGVQPGAEDILKALIDTGYVFDSSVVPGLVSKSRILQTDFSAAPAAFNYFVSPESGFFKPAGSGIFEIPIAASRIGRYFTVKNFISRKLGEAQGAGVRREGMTVTQSLGCERVRMGPAERVKNYFSKLVWPGGGWAMLDLCSDPQSMYYLTKRYLRNVRPEDKDVYFAMSCHSKDVTGEKLDALAAYWKLLKNHYGAGIGALSFMEAARKVT